MHEKPQTLPLQPIAKEPLPIHATPVPTVYPVPVITYFLPIIPTALPKGQHYAPQGVQYNPLPRFQASPIFFKPITYNQPNRHKSPFLDMTQMFYNMPKPKQLILPVSRP